MMGKEIEFRPATFYLGVADMLAGEVEGQVRSGVGGRKLGSDAGLEEQKQSVGMGAGKEGVEAVVSWVPKGGINAGAGEDGVHAKVMESSAVTGANVEEVNRTGSPSRCSRTGSVEGRTKVGGTDVREQTGEGREWGGG
jgi:hypothetical protein